MSINRLIFASFVVMGLALGAAPAFAQNAATTDARPRPAGELRSNLQEHRAEHTAAVEERKADIEVRKEAHVEQMAENKEAREDLKEEMKDATREEKAAARTEHRTKALAAHTEHIRSFASRSTEVHLAAAERMSKLADRIEASLDALTDKHSLDFSEASSRLASVRSAIAEAEAYIGTIASQYEALITELEGVTTKEQVQAVVAKMKEVTGTSKDMLRSIHGQKDDEGNVPANSLRGVVQAIKDTISAARAAAGADNTEE